MTALPRPGAATLYGFAAGAVVALYPGQLPRDVAVQLAVTVLFGTAGALAGRGVIRLTGRGGAPSAASVRVLLYGVGAALVAWLLWQNRLREAAAVAPIGPLGFAALATGALAAPFLWPVVVLAARTARRRARVAALAAVVGLASVAYPAAAQPAEPPQASYAERFATIDSASPGIRVFGSLSDGASPSARADAAVERLVRAGGLARRAVVVAVPTGSGWVDPHFVRGVEEALHGDVAIVAVQYTQQPSWQSFLLHRDAADASAAAVVEVLHRRAPSTPVLLYGQSLGAAGVVAAARRAHELSQPVAGTLQVGTPAGVDVVGPVQLNSSDPVGIWSPRLVIAPPDRAATVPGRATPRPPWLPVVGFVQASIDLLGATAPPPGLGHRYDERQGSDLVDALLSPGGLPRAA